MAVFALRPPRTNVITVAYHKLATIIQSCKTGGCSSTGHVRGSSMRTSRASITEVMGCLVPERKDSILFLHQTDMESALADQ